MNAPAAFQVVIASHLYYEFDIEQDSTHKTMLMKQETEQLEWFLSILERPLDRGRLIQT